MSEEKLKIVEEYYNEYISLEELKFAKYYLEEILSDLVEESFIKKEENAAYVTIRVLFPFIKANKIIFDRRTEVFYAVILKKNINEITEFDIVESLFYRDRYSIEDIEIFTGLNAIEKAFYKMIQSLFGSLTILRGISFFSESYTTKILVLLVTIETNKTLVIELNSSSIRR